MFRHCHPEADWKLASRATVCTLIRASIKLFPEFRTRFHRKTRRCVELGRVGFRAGIDLKKRTQNTTTLVLPSLHKTGVYNTSAKPGQTHKQEM